MTSRGTSEPGARNPESLLDGPPKGGEAQQSNMASGASGASRTSGPGADAESVNALAGSGTEPSVSVATDVLPLVPPPFGGRNGAAAHLKPATSASHGTRAHTAEAVTTRTPSAPATDEDELVRRAAAGDAVAFKALFVRHRADVARLVYRMLSGTADLEDVIQEVFVQVFRSLKDFRGQSKFSTWLHRVTVNVVLMHRRSAKSRPVLTEEASNETVADAEQVLPDDDAERRERMRAFERILARLADKKRIVFVLHELEGMSPAEISEIVGAPVLTVRTRLFYARRELEAMFAEEPALANLASVASATADEPNEKNAKAKRSEKERRAEKARDQEEEDAP